MRFRPFIFFLAAACCGLWAMGCSHDTDEADLQPSGVLISSALTANPHDVAGFLFEIECANGFVHAEYVPLEDEFLPEWLDPLAGAEHFFSDLFAIIEAPTECKVVATPMQDADTPSEECKPVMGEFSVDESLTTEIVLMAECRGDPTGAGDIVAGLNDPPVIEDLSLYPSKFVCTGEQLEIKILALDPNGDEISYNFQVTVWPGQPAPGSFDLIADPIDPYHATFVAHDPGYYEITVTVTDVYGASTQLTFPVHVSLCDVCCFLPKQNIYITTDTDQACKEMHGYVVADEQCEQVVEVCCQFPDGAIIVVDEIKCKENGGLFLPMEQCLDKRF